MAALNIFTVTKDTFRQWRYRDLPVLLRIRFLPNHALPSCVCDTYLVGRMDTPIPKRIIRVTVLDKTAGFTTITIMTEVGVFRKLYLFITYKSPFFAIGTMRWFAAFFIGGFCCLNKKMFFGILLCTADHGSPLG